MKVTNGEIASTIEPLQKLMAMKWPVNTSLEIVKLVTKLQVPLSEINIVKQGLLKTYGIICEQDEMGSTIKSEVEGNVPKYLAEATELAKIEVELKVSEKNKIKLPQKVGGKPLQIEPSVLMALEKFIEIA